MGSPPVRSCYTYIRAGSAGCGLWGRRGNFFCASFCEMTEDIVFREEGCSLPTGIEGVEYIHARKHFRREGGVVVYHVEFSVRNSGDFAEVFTDLGFAGRRIPAISQRSSPT